MTDRPSKEATSQSSNVAKNFAHIASVFRSAEALAHIQPTLRLPDPQEDYELLPYGLSDRVTEDLGEACFYMIETFFTRVKLDFAFPRFYYEVLSVCRVAPIQIHPNG